MLSISQLILEITKFIVNTVKLKVQVTDVRKNTCQYKY